MGITVLAALLLLFLVAAFCFGFQKTCLSVYYVVKYAVFKTIEFFTRVVLAAFGINSYIWMSWTVLVLLTVCWGNHGTFGFVLLTLNGLFGWLVIMLIVRNFRDEFDRDMIRMILARLEHKLCFKNKKLSMYPDDWHWLDT